MKTQIRIAALAAALAFAGGAHAQDPSLRANFGEVSLSAGFTPDPYTVSLTAGGSIDGARLPGACVGHISAAPDFQLTYEAGGFPLVFRTLSAQDTTLIINGPDGRWHCDDDSYGDGDAMVRFNRPQSGVYDVWVGVFGGGTAAATLQVTETP